MAEGGASWVLQGVCDLEFNQIYELFDLDACVSDHARQVRGQLGRLNISYYFQYLTLHT